MKRINIATAVTLCTLIAYSFGNLHVANAEDKSEAGLPFGLRGISWEMTPREIHEHAKNALYMECTPFNEASFYCVHPNSSMQWPHSVEESWIGFGHATSQRPDGVPENGEYISFGCEFLNTCPMHINDLAARLLDLDKMIITRREEVPLGGVHFYGKGHKGEVIVLKGYPSAHFNIPANVGTVITVYKGGFK
ncbi:MULTISPECIES: hypothetical protein [unclassified Yoonia]|uniref:hypothetical protein n=1 Tax=unclassified Yoonia TaxID=2629118 RepID=UPI002AFE3E54|nr:MULTISPECIES: hypothetical protein [unclassified Yoonia]